MDRVALDGSMIAAGRRFLEAIEEIGLSPQGAAWVFEHELEEWRYFLVTSLTDLWGPTRIYGQIRALWPALRVPEGFSIEDVHIGSPREIAFHRIAAMDPQAEGFVRGPVNEDTGYPLDAYVYRMRGVPTPEQERAAELAFERIEKGLRAA